MIRMSAFALVFLFLNACHVEMDRGLDRGHPGDECPDDADATSSADDSGTVCAAFCNHLFTCGSIAPDGYEACVGGCHTKFSVAPAKTRAGCQCVTASQCPADGVFSCPGAPLPGTDKTGASSGSAGSGSGGAGSTADGGSTASTDAGSASSDVGVYACTKNIDCAWSEDCVNGACRVRCKASCECHSAESCVGNYCTAAAPAPKSCVTDCECPSGGQCVGGACK